MSMYQSNDEVGETGAEVDEFLDLDPDSEEHDRYEAAEDPTRRPTGAPPLPVVADDDASRSRLD